MTVSLPVGKLKLQGAVTTRNWRTVLALTQLLEPGRATVAARLK